MSTPLTVQLAEAFGSKPVGEPVDELEQKLIDAFGEEAAALDNLWRAGREATS